NYLKVFPNPTQNQLSIELPFDPKNAQFIIYNELGQLQKIYTKIANRSSTFNISEFSEGQYYGVIEDGEKRITAKFIVTK
ncbi:MAG: T9SS type A sorting domain-containing protein, partial [Bacteroidetes bacterium]|nr:T9SS type A sorting domain-containing protein [Bacteroidota bacterium]